MFHIRDEGQQYKNGFNFYPKGNQHSRGFVFTLTALKNRYTWWMRYSLHLKKLICIFNMQPRVISDQRMAEITAKADEINDRRL